LNIQINDFSQQTSGMPSREEAEAAEEHPPPADEVTDPVGPGTPWVLTVVAPDS